MIDAIPRYVFTIPRQTFPVPEPKINNFSRVHIANSHKLSPQPGKWPFLCDSFQVLPKWESLHFETSTQREGRSINWFIPRLLAHDRCPQHTPHTRFGRHDLEPTLKGLAAISKSMELCRLGKKKNDVNCKPIIFLQKKQPFRLRFFFHKHFSKAQSAQTADCPMISV